MAEGSISVDLAEQWSEPFFRYADTVGDGSGTINFNGDYSSVAEQAILAAGGTQDLAVYRLIVSVQDTATMQAEEYGNLGAALANGIELKHVAANGSTVINDMSNSNPVTINAEWGALCYDVDVKSWGAGDELMLVRWTFNNAGAPIHLKPGESLRLFLSDNFDGLILQCFMFQGVDRSIQH